MQGALAAGFVVAVVGSLFLTEQYYPPLWFLPAIAASLASSRPDIVLDDLDVTAADLGASTLLPPVHQ
jgi:hypothetical protein